MNGADTGVFDPEGAPWTEEPVAGRTLFTVALRDTGATVVLSMAGELDLDSADTLRTTLDAAMAGSATRVVLDCSALRFCDSTGLNTLLTAHRAGRLRGCELQLAAVQPTVLRMLQITGVDTILPLHLTVDDALAAR